MMSVLRTLHPTTKAVALLCLLLCCTPVQAQSPPDASKPEKNEPSKQQEADKPQQANQDKADSPDAGSKKSQTYAFAGQTTLVWQNLFKFHSLYQGPNSLRSQNEGDLTNTYTLFFGAKLSRRLEAFIDPEWAIGTGLSNGAGLGGFTNGELIGQSSLRPEPYLARFFVRWRIPTALKGDTEPAVEIGRSQNVIETTVPAHRLVMVAGKLAISDVFDGNGYANDPRTQFLNDVFTNNLAYDFAQDSRGYTQGIALALVNPDWALRIGTFQMPTVAGGPDLAGFGDNRGDQIELEVHPRLFGKRRKPTILRLLAYHNIATMGNFRDALAQAKLTGMTPDVTAVRKKDVHKYGYGLNFEQSLSDGGATGVFGRYGWNDGATESFAYAECDRTISFGGQLSGKRWHRPNDWWSLAWAQNDLSAAHKNYLEAGGLGSAVGDGALNYGPERILETYYAYSVSKPLTVSLDYQYISNPGYNRDRGPVSLLSLRAHYEF